jgi:hypothetical protein
MGDEHVEFFERSLIKQQINTFPRGQFALGMLRINAALPPTETSNIPARRQFLKIVAHVAPRSFGSA